MDDPFKSRIRLLHMVRLVALKAATPPLVSAARMAAAGVQRDLRTAIIVARGNRNS